MISLADFWYNFTGVYKEPEISPSTLNTKWQDFIWLWLHRYFSSYIIVTKLEFIQKFMWKIEFHMCMDCASTLDYKDSLMSGWWHSRVPCQVTVYNLGWFHEEEGRIFIQDRILGTHVGIFCIVFNFLFFFVSFMNMIYM